MGAFAPEAYLTAPVWGWGPRYVAVIEAAQAGTYTPGYYWGSMAYGVVDLAPIAADVDSGVKDQVLAAKEAIIAGDLHPFTGPLYDQVGNLVLAAGELEGRTRSIASVSCAGHRRFRQRAKGHSRSA